ncbi:hypothetical protein BC833DRAFT_619331 [Globomyces pollinis-pini]|nr:hypothetical protein BC833DRAFT_619331 [Globomyces pollinis-pini]
MSKVSTCYYDNQYNHQRIKHELNRIDPNHPKFIQTLQKCIQCTVSEPGIQTQSYEFSFPNEIGIVNFTAYQIQQFNKLKQLQSINHKQIQSIMSQEFHKIRNQGNSESMFYQSKCKFMYIKSLKQNELQNMLTFLTEYMIYMQQHPNTFLPRYLGMYTIKYNPNLETQTKYHFIIMTNWFYSIHQPILKFDLKGSQLNRSRIHQDHYTAIEIWKRVCEGDMVDIVLKENDLMELDLNSDFIFLDFNIQTTLRILNQLKSDINLLQLYRFMDYSFVIGIHFINQGDHRVTIDSSPKDRSEFKKDEGGLRNKDRVYFFGLVDILQEYGVVKKVERGLKRTRSFMGEVLNGTDGGLEVSVEEPVRYGSRLFHYVKNRFCSHI